MGKFSDETVQSLQRRVDAASADPEHGLPGTVVVVVDRDGKELFAHAGGTRGYGSPEPMTLDNVFWIASCTKMIVGMACMQLVEKRLLSLDDSQQVEQLCPELKEVKVLQDDGNLVEKKRGITLRMLLSHTGESPAVYAVGRMTTRHSPKVWHGISRVRILVLQREAEGLPSADRIR